jgi:hypothetical protein
VDRIAADLRRDLLQLREDRPSLAGPIVLGLIGTALSTGGGVVVNLGREFANRDPNFLHLLFNGPIGMLISLVGIVVAVGGIALVIVAIVQHIRVKVARDSHDERVAELERRIELLERDPDPRTTAPPAMPGPQVLRSTGPMFMVARF